MKNWATLGYCVLLMLVLGVGWRCAGDGSSGLDQAARQPGQPETPEAAVFDYLLYDNDFNAVPIDADPKRYVTTELDSAQVGLVYELTAEREFSPGVHARIATTNDQGWYRIEFKALQRAKDVKPALQRGFVIISIQRGDSTIQYQSYSIDEWLKQYRRHLIDKWETLTMWHPVPAVQPNDELKIYLWNPEGGTLHVDDLRVEVWRQAPAYAQTHTKSHVLTELTYEGEGWGPQHTKERAYRGLGAALLFNGDGGTAYGSGYEATLEAAKVAAGDALQIEVVALKQHGVRQADQAARLVCSVERNGQVVFWKGWAIDPRLWKDGRQTLNEWHSLTWWVELPADIRSGDQLRIYPWNDTKQRIFLDDLKATVWKAPSS